jgi:membrane complex biogenesis BtpA family protein
MLSRDAFRSRFGDHPVFGMVHLRALPGAPLFDGSMDRVIDAALADARAICDGGAAGIVFENFGDRPFVRGRVGAETIAAMTRVIAEAARAVHLPFGVNVLRNDARSALAIAAATGAAFIRVNVHTGVMFTDQGVIEGEAAETLRLRAALAPHVLIFADHLVKHATPPPGTDVVQAAKDLRLRGLADAVIVSGSETGGACDPARIALLRDAIDAPLLIGSGLTAANCAAYADADGAIAGTSIKRDADVEAPVDARRVEKIVNAFRSSGGR